MQLLLGLVGQHLILSALKLGQVLVQFLPVLLPLLVVAAVEQLT
jgi:hypothetical protein